MPTEVTIQNLIEIDIVLPISEYEDQLDAINQAMGNITELVCVSADCVIRTWVMNTFYEWFTEYDMDALDYYLWAELPGGVVPLLGAGEVGDDVKVQFGFGPDEKDVATLFKLTFGGK